MSTSQSQSQSQSWSASFASSTVDAMCAYDAVVPFMFDPWAAALLDEVGVTSGEAVLDVATGPGTVARQAAPRVGPSGRVTACDISPAMLAVATAKPVLDGAAPIIYLQCPADALDVSDGTFDVALCQQGLQFFPDRRGALIEIRRALKPAGRVGVNVWCGIEHCRPFEALSIALGAVLGVETQRTYRSGPWGLGDAAELTRLFEEAGFTDVRVERRTLPIIFEGGPAQLVATLPTAAVAPQVAALDDQGGADLLAATTEALAPLLHDGAVRSEMAAHVVRATR
ncbi:MAG TPA: class I SAM-dependent methyltransferase [Acidimicrobiales bacterium]|nr:class I SAM-dependent methyltransferase [Acidimicrobiales bacterium]